MARQAKGGSMKESGSEDQCARFVQASEEKTTKITDSDHHIADKMIRRINYLVLPIVK